MQCLEVSGAVRPIYESLGVKRLTETCQVLTRRVNSASDFCASGVEAKLHSIQAVSKLEHSSNVTVTAVPDIRSTRLHGGTSSTQYLVAKQIQNIKRQNLNSTAAILCKTNNFRLKYFCQY